MSDSYFVSSINGKFNSTDTVINEVKDIKTREWVKKTILKANTLGIDAGRMIVESINSEDVLRTLGKELTYNNFNILAEAIKLETGSEVKCDLTLNGLDMIDGWKSLKAGLLESDKRNEYETDGYIDYTIRIYDNSSEYLNATDRNRVIVGVSTDRETILARCSSLAISIATVIVNMHKEVSKGMMGQQDILLMLKGKPMTDLAEVMGNEGSANRFVCIKIRAIHNALKSEEDSSNSASWVYKFRNPKRCNKSVR